MLLERGTGNGERGTGNGERGARNKHGERENENWEQNREFEIKFNRGRISSVGRALDCRAGGRGLDSLDRTNTEGLEITEK